MSAGSELIHFQVNQTKKINFRCRKHEGAILGLLAGTGNRVPWTRDVPGDIIGDMGTNTNFIITDEDVELGPRWRTPEALAWMSGKSMKAFSVKGYVLAFSDSSMMSHHGSPMLKLTLRNSTIAKSGT